MLYMYAEMHPIWGLRFLAIQHLLANEGSHDRADRLLPRDAVLRWFSAGIKHASLV